MTRVDESLNRATVKAYRRSQAHITMDSTSRISSGYSNISRMSSRDSAYFSKKQPVLCQDDSEVVENGALLKNLLKETSKSREHKLSCARGNYPSNGVWNVCGLTIDSNFESGNLGRVEYNCDPISDEDAVDRRQGRRPTPDFEFRCWVAPDMHGTEFENKNKSWFHFRVKDGAGKCVRFNMMNLNKHTKLFNQGMLPVFMSARKDTPLSELPNILENPERWSRVQCAFTHFLNGEFLLSFWQRLAPSYDYYFSFTYPCSVRDQTEYINKLEKRFSFHPYIYFHRELLCISHDLNPVELLTISSYRDITDESEPNFAHNLPPPLPTRANDPNRGDNMAFRVDVNRTSRKFKNKRVYIISARVHPGETPASHVMKGCLDFLLRENDGRAVALRDKFIFKIIPIINPDGVIRGHYRTDARGQNLNRFYDNPDHILHPQCYAYRQLVSYVSDAYKLEEKVRGDVDDVNETMSSGVAFLIDLHAHAAKRGCFLYGNRLKSAKLQAEILLYARLTSANSPFMDFDGCCFSQRNMVLKEKRDENLSKEGSARVAFYYLTGSPHIYTLECNYNTGKFMNSIASGRNGAVTPPLPTMPNRKYTPNDYSNVGAGLLNASLDIFDCNPLPRVAPNQVKALRAQIHRQVMTQRQNGKPLKITAKSTLHVISTDRLSTAKKTLSPPVSHSASNIDNISLRQPVWKKMSSLSLKEKPEPILPQRKSRLPRLKPKETIPQTNITISFVSPT